MGSTTQHRTLPHRLLAILATLSLLLTAFAPAALSAVDDLPADPDLDTGTLETDPDPDPDPDADRETDDSDHTDPVDTDEQPPPPPTDPSQPDVTDEPADGDRLGDDGTEVERAPPAAVDEPAMAEATEALTDSYQRSTTTQDLSGRSVCDYTAQSVTINVRVQHGGSRIGYGTVRAYEQNTATVTYEVNYPGRAPEIRSTTAGLTLNEDGELHQHIVAVFDLDLGPYVTGLIDVVANTVHDPHDHVGMWVLVRQCEQATWTQHSHDVNQLGFWVTGESCAPDSGMQLRVPTAFEVQTVDGQPFPADGLHLSRDHSSSTNALYEYLFPYMRPSISSDRLLQLTDPTTIELTPTATGFQLDHVFTIAPNPNIRIDRIWIGLYHAAPGFDDVAAPQVTVTTAPPEDWELVCDVPAVPTWQTVHGGFLNQQLPDAPSACAPGSELELHVPTRFSGVSTPGAFQHRAHPDLGYDHAYLLRSDRSDWELPVRQELVIDGDDLVLSNVFTMPRWTRPTVAQLEVHHQYLAAELQVTAEVGGPDTWQLQCATELTGTVVQPNLDELIACPYGASMEVTMTVPFDGAPPSSAEVQRDETFSNGQVQTELLGHEITDQAVVATWRSFGSGQLSAMTAAISHDDTTTVGEPVITQRCINRYDWLTTPRTNFPEPDPACDGRDLLLLRHVREFPHLSTVDGLELLSFSGYVKDSIGLGQAHPLVDVTFEEHDGRVRVLHDHLIPRENTLSSFMEYRLWHVEHTLPVDATYGGRPQAAQGRWILTCGPDDPADDGGEVEAPPAPEPADPGTPPAPSPVTPPPSDIDTDDDTDVLDEVVDADDPTELPITTPTDPDTEVLDEVAESDDPDSTDPDTHDTRDAATAADGTQEVAAPADQTTALANTGANTLLLLVLALASLMVGRRLLRVTAPDRTR